MIEDLKSIMRKKNLASLNKKKIIAVQSFIGRFMSSMRARFPVCRLLSLRETSARRNVIRTTGRTTQFLVSHRSWFDEKKRYGTAYAACES